MSQPWAHPRACGENRFDTDPLLHADGSSPRVRGKQRGVGDQDGGSGLIPARAGKTPLHDGPLRGGRAHPRACGENAVRVGRRVAQTGSSPRVRGKRFLRGGSRARGRLIPARAGKTLRRLSPPISGRAHPRACGENPRDGAGQALGPGSSPRVRGKRPLGLLGLRDRGLIPARAGKTRASIHRFPNARAHPRACGENDLPKGGIDLGLGSSPRVRGKRRQVSSSSLLAGLIPARAGKTPA